MIRFKIVLVLIILSNGLSSCSKREVTIVCQDASCRVDEEFCTDFNKAIYDIQFAQGETSFADRQNAMFFFAAVTGIKSRANDYHHPVYDAERELREDLRQWEDWFAKNKCLITKAKADSLIRVYRGE